jgi:hypothetical protein
VCADRTAEQSYTVYGELEFTPSGASLATIAPTAADIITFQNEMVRQLALAIGVDSSRITPRGLEPIITGTFKFTFHVLPPATLTEPTATAVVVSISGVTTGTTPMLVAYGGHTLPPTGGRSWILTDVVTTTATTATATTITTTRTATNTTVTSTTPTTVVDDDSNNENAAASASFGGADGWTMKDTILLLILLAATVLLMAIIFTVVYVKRKRQNLATEFKATVLRGVPAGADWWRGQQQQGGYAIANPAYDVDGAHYYPAGDQPSAW